MRIVGGAVKRINVPAEFGSRSALVSRSLFGRNGMIRKVLSELLDDEPLRALVSLCNEIYFVPFVANVEWERQFFNQNFPCFLGDFDGSCKIVLRHSADPE